MQLPAPGYVAARDGAIFPDTFVHLLFSCASPQRAASSIKLPKVTLPLRAGMTPEGDPALSGLNPY
eukprot:3902279-Pyramimonas_sp.AAC.1